MQHHHITNGDRMCRVRVYHDDIWTCHHKLDCVLLGCCLDQKLKNYYACAPYPGPPNYPLPVPARITKTVHHFNYPLWRKWFTIAYIHMRGYVHDKDTGV